jgi:hypothetical protein
MRPSLQKLLGLLLAVYCASASAQGTPLQVVRDRPELLSSADGNTLRIGRHQLSVPLGWTFSHQQTLTKLQAPYRLRVHVGVILHAAPNAGATLEGRMLAARRHALSTVEMLCSSDRTPVVADLERTTDRQIVSARCENPLGIEVDDFFGYYAIIIGDALIQVTGVSEGDARGSQRTVEALVRSVKERR